MHLIRFVGLLLSALLGLSSLGFGQYYGGGYGGYGRSMGGMGMGSASASSKPAVPNIGGELANRETKWLKEKLNLTKEQAKAVKDLNNEYGRLQQEAIKEIVAIGGGKPSEAQTQQIKDAMLMYNEEKEGKLKQILTPDQWATYQRSKDAMQREVSGARPPAPPEFRTDSTRTN